MKFENSKDNRIKKLAKIFNDVDILHEYKVQADLADISRRNYLFLFDPFVIYWIAKMYGNWPMIMIGICVDSVSGSVLGYCIHRAFSLFGFAFTIIAMQAFDNGYYIAKKTLDSIL